MTSHDPNHAFMLDAEVACVGRDGAVRGGRAHEVLEPGFLGDLYGIEVGVGRVVGPSGGASVACAPILSDEGEDA